MTGAMHAVLSKHCRISRNHYDTCIGGAEVEGAVERGGGGEVVGWGGQWFWEKTQSQCEDQWKQNGLIVRFTLKERWLFSYL